MRNNIVNDKFYIKLKNLTNYFIEKKIENNINIDNE